MAVSKSTFSTVASHLTEHPELAGSFKASPVATLDAEGILLSDAAISSIEEFLATNTFSEDADVAADQAKLLAVL
ncbi:hypothetical protein GCM10010413_07190 [Promicromonospora sukumoe]|uniref:Uncharacterized protein n=1 Tax=Promicromonospora sukumoe TaxID=88382 RepID=A0A7W3J541_9MICO|nr:hypothetical protein [Promicromonospora sukumoe]MBA8806390.1 hypothetical protein [Promicromonospora sukumoe]